MSERTPTPEQQAAITVGGRDVLLEAGAGTGKTGVMVDRYCRLVCDKGVSPDAILAFTFTDKAAAELRQRIRVELAGVLSAGDRELASSPDHVVCHGYLPHAESIDLLRAAGCSL